MASKPLANDVTSRGPASVLTAQCLAWTARVAYAGFAVLIYRWEYHVGQMPSWRRIGDGIASLKDTNLAWGWHPMLLGIAFVVLMTEALGTYRVVEVAQGTSHSKAKAIHGLLMATSAAFAFFGWYVIHTVKAPNTSYMSAHAWVGAVALIILAVQFLTASVVFVVGSKALRAKLIGWHRLAGVTVYGAGMCATLMGIQEHQRGISCPPNVEGGMWCSSKLTGGAAAAFAVVAAGCALAVRQLHPAPNPAPPQQLQAVASDTDAACRAWDQEFQAPLNGVQHQGTYGAGASGTGPA